MLDEVEDLHDRRVHDLGEELPFGHRDRLRFGVAGVHQTLEDDRAFVDVVIDGEVDPAQSAVRDTALDLVLIGDQVAGAQLRQEGVGGPAIGAEAFKRARIPGSLAGSAHRPSAVPAEPFRLGDNGIDHHGGERVDLGHPGDLHQTAAQPTGRGGRGKRDRDLLALVRSAGEDILVVVIEVGPEDRLGRHRAHGRDGSGAGILEFGQARPLGTGLMVVEIVHQSEYLGAGGAGAGPRTVSHFR